MLKDHLNLRNLLIACVVIVIIILLYLRFKPQGPTMEDYPKTRLPGAGHISGSSADELSEPKKYGYATQSVEECRQDCLVNPDCQQYVHYNDEDEEKDNDACFLMRSIPEIPNNFVYSQDPAWQSGIKKA